MCEHAVYICVYMQTTFVAPSLPLYCLKSSRIRYVGYMDDNIQYRFAKITLI